MSTLQDETRAPEAADAEAADAEAAEAAEKRQKLEATWRALPATRMAPYLQRAGGNPYTALSLYRWNSQISAALFETIGHFEVSYRNRIDQALTERNQFKKRTADWLDNANGELADKAVEAIEEAKKRAARKPSGHSRGNVIAELNFSFWRRLIDARHRDTFGSAIMRKYPTLIKRTGARNDMSSLVALVEPIYSIRNRVAHHEPIITLNPAGRRNDMVTLIGMQNPDLAVWVRGNCRLDALMKK